VSNLTTIVKPMANAGHSSKHSSAMLDMAGNVAIMSITQVIRTRSPPIMENFQCRTTVTNEDIAWFLKETKLMYTMR
jgi:hypothetical protein